METITNERLAKMMALVQRLLTEADNLDQFVSASGQEGDPEERRLAAANYREKAESLMRQYRIEEEDLVVTDRGAVTPVMHSMFLYFKTPFTAQYWDMMHFICRHAEIHRVFRYNREGEQPGMWVDLFGYEIDLRLAEMLWSSARLVFGSHLEPTVDPKLGDQINAYNLRQSGLLRKDIAIRLWGENTPALRSRAQRLYVAECKRRGEQPALEGLGTDAETYRTAYADGFVSALSDRLRAARDAADARGGVVEFRGRRERVLEFMYSVYPDRRPKPRTEVAVTTPPVPAKVDRRRKAWTKKDEARYVRENGASADAGRRAGRAAARHVDIARTTEPNLHLEA